jgi:E3 ubiquitin-protein ligase RFWD2
VTKRIKLYDYAQVVAQKGIDAHPPIKEMACRSKISCLSWNQYLKERLASSGLVFLACVCLD